MFVAHAPAGYLLSRALRRHPRWSAVPLHLPTLAAVIPDLDAIPWLLDGGANRVHHAYWLHLPFFWLALGLVAWVGWRAGRARVEALVAGVLVGHLALDSTAGAIRWLHPISPEWFSLAEILPRYEFHFGSIHLHWLTLLELPIGLASLVAWMRARRAGETQRA